jgi:hypothetical protein
MATRGTIFIEREDGTFEGIYTHWDSYPSHNGKILHNHYNTEEKVNELLANGELSSLLETIEDTEFYNQGNKNYQAKTLKDTEKFAEEYNYIFRDGIWYFYEDENLGDLKLLKAALV